MNKHLKRILITVLILGIIGGGTYGGLTVARNASRKPVNVYRVSDFSTTNDDMGMNWYSGLTKMDNMQKIYLSSTQAVRKVYVEEGQEVKAGDPLLSYDTTLSMLDVEKAEIALEKKKMELENNKRLLEELKTARVTEDIEAVMNSLEAQLEQAYENLPEPEYPKIPRGKWTEEKPYYMENTGTLDMEELFRKSGKNDIYVVLVDVFDDEYMNYTGLHLTKKRVPEPETETEEPSSEEPSTEETQEESSEETSSEEPSTEETPSEEAPEESSEEASSQEESPEETSSEESQEEETSSEETSGEDESEETSSEEALSSEEPEPVKSGTARLFGKEETGGYSFELFPAEPLEPKEQPESQLIKSLEAQMEQVSALFEHSYGREELAELRASTEKALSDLELDIRIAEVELEKSKAEVNDGKICANISGVVKSVLPLSEMNATDDAAVVISGGGGYIVTANVGEYDLEKMTLGGTAFISSWESGESYEGSITEIGERPSDETGWSNGNNNVSWYPVRISVSDDANLKDWEYVDVQFNDLTAEADNSLYLDKCMVRTDGSRSYVYRQNEEGRLQKTWIRTGKDLWGSYIQVKSGLTQEDLVAFPYGRDVTDGAETVEAGPEALWNSAY